MFPPLAFDRPITGSPDHPMLNPCVSEYLPVTPLFPSICREKSAKPIVSEYLPCFDFFH